MKKMKLLEYGIVEERVLCVRLMSVEFSVCLLLSRQTQVQPDRTEGAPSFCVGNCPTEFLPLGWRTLASDWAGEQGKWGYGMSLVASVIGWLVRFLWAVMYRVEQTNRYPKLLCFSTP